MGYRPGSLALVLLAAAAPLFSAQAEARPAVPFIEDDYPKALAEAKAKKMPLFVEAWAPW